MLRLLLFVYLLGAVTFWPLAAFVVWYLIVNAAPSEQTHSALEKEKTSTDAEPQDEISDRSHLRTLIDRTSDVEASGWVWLAPVYINKMDPLDDNGDKGGRTSRSAIRRLVSARLSGTTLPELPSPPKSVSKCPKLWAVVRGRQLQLFEDEGMKKLFEVVYVPDYVVLLWPQALPEFELFYTRHPLCLVSRSDKLAIESLALNPETPPSTAVYIYMLNSSTKEDLYFSLVKASSNGRIGNGIKDPRTHARPFRPLQSEAQQLQSKIWNSEANAETQWLNGLLGRIFLGVKNTPVLDDYLRRKFQYKLEPISKSSNIIGDIEVKQIDCGTAAPIVTRARLRELSTDGNLLVSLDVAYSGGFKVILATKVRLSALSSLTNAEIPVELACTVSSLEGTMLVRIKPPPSDRLWYCFETMPRVDLHIEPMVYEKQISLSVVTKFIRGKLLDSLRDSLVYPQMEDLSFYNTEASFYRGGIWHPPTAGSEGAIGSTTADVSAVTSAVTSTVTSTDASAVTSTADVSADASTADTSTADTSTASVDVPAVPAVPAGAIAPANDYAESIASTAGLSPVSPPSLVNASSVNPINVSNSSVSEPKLELPSFSHKATPSTELFSQEVGGELIEPDGAEKTRPASVRPASLRLRRQSVDSTSSKASRGSSLAPSLPPRNRRVVPLANVAPEHL